MSRLIGVVEPFVAGSNFLAFKDRIRQFFKINQIKEDDKTAFFVTIMGAEMYEVAMSLTIPNLPSCLSFEDLIKELKNHYAPKKKKRAERYKFNKLSQQQNESINDFIVRLKAAASTCKF